jgi:hypothetical protein
MLLSAYFATWAKEITFPEYVATSYPFEIGLRATNPFPLVELISLTMTGNAYFRLS